GVRFGAGIRGLTRDSHLRTRSAEKREFHGPSADSATSCARCRQGGRPTVNRANQIVRVGFLLAGLNLGSAHLTQAQQDTDHTLQAMRDEMARAKTRLELTIPGTDQPVRPYYIEYRLLDLEVRQVVAQFGTVLSSTRTRNRFMDVEARVGSY